jgi:hypothetical protein
LRIHDYSCSATVTRSNPNSFGDESEAPSETVLWKGSRNKFTLFGDGEQILMNTWTRTGLAVVLGLSIGTFVSFVNGRDFVSALQAGFGFALLVGFIVAVLSCGMDVAVEKGYPGWLGFLLVLCLNIVGLIILALLPAHTPASNPPTVR